MNDWDPATDDTLDKGIRVAVIILRQHGIETFESCEGGEGHAYPEPTVAFHGTKWAGYKAFAVAMEHGLPVYQLNHYFGVIDGILDGPSWQLVFAPEIREIEP